MLGCPATDVAISVRELRKVFQYRERTTGFLGPLRSLWSNRIREVVAVDRIEFTVPRGQRVAFIGPNGAGKSTSLKMLCGILRPSSGEVSVLGHTPWRERKALGFRIGTVFGQRTQLWYHLPASDTFDLLARIYELDWSSYLQRRDALVDLFQIGSWLGSPVSKLSLGQRMRCELVASLLHRPEVLFLDEPTIGLDVSAKAVIRDLVHRASIDEGTTVLLTSHDPGDMERVCERVIVVNDGRVVLDRPVRELRTQFLNRKRITLLTAAAAIELELPGVSLASREPYRIVIDVDTNVTPVEAVVQAALNASRVRDLTVENPPMEEIVQEIYERRGMAACRS